MNRIIFPIGPDSQGQALADLQAGLRFLVKDDFFGFNADESKAAIAGLDEESLQNKYGVTTKDLVSLFQKASALEVTGAVDKNTAFTLNEKLQARGAFAAHFGRPAARGRLRGQQSRGRLGAAAERAAAPVRQPDRQRGPEEKRGQTQF